MINFPYGNSNFHAIRTEGKLYLDRTQHIPLLEQAGEQLVFLRPRRFGKSLLLSTLANYYDINRAGEFAALFGDLAVGQNPTGEQNQYTVLRWDFSKVSAQGDTAAITRHLFDHINQAIKYFALQYRQYLQTDINILADNAIASFESLVNAVASSGQQLYLLIDEYDNFANEVLMQTRPHQQRYEDLVQSEGILKTLFKAIKANASEGKIGRVFITGVSPLVMSDMTSGYNVATHIYLEPKFNTLCGVTTPELTQLVTTISAECQQPSDSVQTTLETMRVFYNGYRFCNDMQQACVYNPTLAFYFLRHYQEYCSAPPQILDGNLAMDANKIRYIANLPAGKAVIANILDEQQAVTLARLENQFGMEKLHDIQTDPDYMVSLLYFFGVLTLSGRGMIGELVLGIPNLVIRGLYVDEIKRNALPDAGDRHSLQRLTDKFYQTADLQPLVAFMESKYFAVFNNRDYRWSNELTVKTAFLTLLFNDTYYIMDSEAALQRRYSDLTLIVRPNMRQYALLDMVLEFKYLPLADLGLSGEQVRAQQRKESAALPAVQTALQEARQQLQQYRVVLEEKYREPQRLRCLAVVALGFERLVWEVC
ncbi:MAG TPA: AAA family ATPase [Candidatus Thiothrix moscowensis]|uniref:AAA family ATPase n=1 Tax=unclassified Thiothrix TaxID=2636184 RepID=UPI0025F6433C|nr:MULTISPECIES: AAA family ATPase [unclassified Thiothrix]HRJ54548.1 AAA family ATPase [Candidatus Thiothrix moscowensis]HRJ94884.1 AAA family ATPase [Candidatus Thiothrix moscowensis]